MHQKCSKTVILALSRGQHNLQPPPCHVSDVDIFFFLAVFHKKVDFTLRKGHFKIEAPSVGSHSLNHSFEGMVRPCLLVKVFLM